MDYMKYWISVLLLAINVAGITLGGNWVWLGIACLPVLAVLDSLTPIDYRMSRITRRWLAYIPVWICAPGVVLLFAYSAWRIKTGDFTSDQLFGIWASLTWASIIPMVPSAHELFHNRHWLPRTIGRYSFVCVLDCTRDIGHVVGHHLDVGTLKDSDTAERGENIYIFALRGIVGSTKYALQYEAQALRSRGLSSWNLRHRAYRALAALVAFDVILFMLGGWTGLAICLGAQLVGRWFIEAINYVQHYGLIRVEGKPVGRRHVWNHLRWISRAATFEITNHADHHINSYQPFYKTVPHQEGIPTPSVFLCFIVMLVPPLWHRVFFRSHLKKWDEEYANDEEREIARRANANSGLPNWFSTRSVGSAPPTVGI